MTAATAEDSGRLSRKERAAARQAERTAKLRARSGHRYLVHYDIDGPRVRLGILWFLGVLVVLPLQRIGVALVYGAAAALASSHGVRTWRARGAPVDPRVALAAGAVVPLAAIVGPPAMGVALIAAVGLIVFASIAAAGDRPPVSALAEASLVLQTTLPPTVAAGCLVLLADLDIGAVVALVLLVSAYETGDYLIGSGSASAIEGPLAGGVAVLVVAATVAALPFTPFSIGEALVFGAAVFPLALAGQYLASAMLPHARAWAPALRRLDSMLLAAPVWYAGVDLFVI